ncbi:hypothetical protein [uncultured Roseobacter sp.]|uniref:hypothetical protein n=1 Tax=uncultured Roseobacter sp. TaxID=114847 RepID=UPI00261BB933|nr:hypothetical protein [uncultured Roseobacter sp.]
MTRALSPSMQAVFDTLTYPMTKRQIAHLLGREGIKKSTVESALYTLKAWGLVEYSKRKRLARGPLKNGNGPMRNLYSRAAQ